MNSQKLIRMIWKKYPKNGQEIWDRCGLQIGKLKSETKRVMVCLDYDSQMCEKAKAIKPDLIITHHPFIFGTRMAILNSDEYKSRVTAITENDLHSCVYSFHTCFDNARYGMNEILAHRLNLENIYIPDNCPSMRIGNLQHEMPLDEFTQYAIDSLGVTYGLLVEGNSRPINKVGIIGGGASRDYIFAQKEKCDIYISGDMAHHTRRDILERHFNYLDIPHEVERVFIKQIVKDIKSLDSSIEIFSFDHEIEAQVVCKKTKI